MHFSRCKTFFFQIRENTQNLFVEIKLLTCLVYKCHPIMYYTLTLANNQSRNQENGSGVVPVCSWYLNAEFDVRQCLVYLPLSLWGLRGLTSIIDQRMHAHYKISALCLSIRVTEEGLMVLPYHSESSTPLPDRTESLRFFCRRAGGWNKTSRYIIKALDLQSLDTGGTSGLQALHGSAIALREPPISPTRRQALPEGFIYKRAENLSRGRRNIRPVIVWYQRMQMHNK